MCEIVYNILITNFTVHRCIIRSNAPSNLQMQPLGCIFVYALNCITFGTAIDPACFASGNKADMEKAIKILEEVKESIINAYEQKCHLSRSKIAKMMSEETWLNAKKALQLGFVDGILFAKEKMPQAEPEEEEEESTEEESSEEAPDEEDDDEDDPDKKEKKPPKDMVSFSYTPARTAASFMQKVSATQTGTPIAQLDKRLELLKY